MAASKSTKSNKRVYRGQSGLDHDLYKLELSKLKRNRAFMPGDMPDYELIEHVHHFHTIDSDGKKLSRSTAIAGHFHEMTLVEESEDGHATYTAGLPMREVRKKVNGRMVKTMEKILNDDHLHEVKYMRSDKIQMRQSHPDAANVIAYDANKTAPIPGVIS